MEIVGERVKEGLKNWKIQGGSNSQVGAKKLFNNNYKNKEGETNSISSYKGKAQQKAPPQVPYFQFPYVAVAQYHVIH